MRAGRVPAAVASPRLDPSVACPFEDRCPCHKGPWCRRKLEDVTGGPCDYRMMTLEGCRDGHCDRPCRMLLHVEELASHFLRAAGISKPPVPLDLVETFDPERPVEIRYLPLNAHYGAVWLVDGEWVLHLNSNQPPAVNRYVAFHEGYHILCQAPSLFAGESADGCRSFNEVIADYFAASILMPRRWVQEMWPRVHDTARLARLFQAPEPAVHSWVRRWCPPDPLADPSG